MRNTEKASFLVQFETTGPDKASMAKVRRVTQNRALIVVFVSTLLVSFQNCSPYHATDLGSLDSSLTTDQLAKFTAAKDVIATHCLSCHSSSGSAKAYSFDFSTQDQFLKSGYVVAGKVGASKLLTRTIHYVGTGAGPQDMPPGNSTGFSTADYNVLKEWVINIGTTSIPTNELAFTCSDPSQISETLSYVLTKTQLTNTITDLFGSAAAAAVSGQLGTLPNESFNQLSNERLTALTSSKVATYSAIADGVATYVTSDDTRTSRVFGSCGLQAAYSQSCVDTFLNGFAKRVLRRPLNASEKAFAHTLVAQSSAFRTGLKNLLSYHLQSPHFIWRIELGGSKDPSGSVLPLTSYEVATRIAFATTDSTPDPELLRAADAGELSTKEQVKGQVDRLLKTIRGKNKVAATLMKWSQSDQINGFTSLPSELTAGIELSGLATAMSNEVKAFINQVVYTNNGSFKDLLTSKDSFASHSGLATLYGHSPASAGAPAMMGGRRQGLLLRSPYFTGSTARTTLIQRGVDFQQHILCNEIPSPNVDISNARDTDAFTADELLFKTTRQAVAHQTRDAVCMSCHAAINPTGNILETLGPLGELRTEEKIFDANGQFVRSLPIDSGDSVPVSPSKSVALTDAYDLADFIGTSSEGTACFSRKVYRFLNEKRENTADDCLLLNVQKAVIDPNRPILEGIAEFIANEYVFNKVIVN